jgi:DEAD/DEAH box helicase domain-containing protein
MADRYPAQGISLRSASPQTVLLEAHEGGESRIIGQVDLASAAWMVHPHAVYMQEGQAYEVEELDLERNLARLLPVETDAFTVPHRETTVRRIQLLREEEVPGAVKAYGEIRVTTRVVGFHRVKWYTHERLGGGDLDLPPSELETAGYWLALKEGTVADLKDRGLWRNDANDYGPGWAEARDLARSRDGYRCQSCGAPEGDRMHDVHHRVPFRAFADPREANGPHNLTTLCGPCHRRAEIAVRMRSGLSGLAFVLGHLAPLFVMCDARDLGVWSEPSSSLAEGRPAVVLYDTVPAGIGLSEGLFDLHGEVLARARDLVADCECVEGCPSCVGPAGENGAGGRRETLAILDALLPAR